MITLRHKVLQFLMSTKHLKIALFAFAIVFNLGIFASSEKNVVQAAQIPCGRASQTYDADCLCPRNQCRMSRIGGPDFNVKGNSNGRTGKGYYDCFAEGVVAGGNSEKDRPTDQSVYVGRAALNDDAGTDPDEIECLGYKDYDYLHPNAISYLETNADGVPCYQFRFTGIEGQRGNIVSLNAARLYSTRGYGLDTDQFNDNALFDKYTKVYPDGTTDDEQLTFKYCSKDRIKISHYFGSLQASGLPSCAEFDVYIKPIQENGQYIRNPVIESSNNGVDYEEYNPDNILKEGKIYQKFLVDEFNHLPNNQNIPQGAVCTVLERDGQSFAYWKIPLDDYFGRDVDENTCDPLFTSVDLFGNEVDGTPTAFGCLPNSFNGLTAFIVRLASGLGTSTTFLIVLINLVKITMNSNNPEVVAESRKKMTSATMTLIGLIASLSILNILGLQILGIGGLGGGLLRIFTGG